jgi:glycosyltransferase involved in cell wall biosynthesis
MTVTVITSSIGRPELRQCIESVRAQTYPVRHAVYVNGPAFHEPARAVLMDYPEIQAVYLPEDTGNYNGSGPGCAGVFAAAPFLTRSDWVFFLNDDDFYDPDHVESVMAFAKSNDLKWAYSLRRFVGKDGAPVCDDNWCSLGYWPIYGTNEYVVDNSCYAMQRCLAERYALAWTVSPLIGDRCMLMALKESGARSGCTGRSTVNYRIGTGSAPDEPEKYHQAAARMRAEFPNGFPWRAPRVFCGNP